MIKIGVVGNKGRMSQRLINIIGNQNDCILSGYFGHNGGTFSSLHELCEKSDIIIDFTTPETTMQCVEYVQNKTYICGTTGLTNDQIEIIKKAGKNAKILLSSNMSIGVAVVQYVLKKIVPLLDDFDIEILEKHHNKKVDSPSGTALSIGKNIAEIKGIDFDKNSIFNRKIVRQKNEIGIASLRGGTVAGEHTVNFFGDNETIELTHKAENRDIFAIGAIKFGKMIYNQQNMGFFDMEYIINLLGEC